MRQTCIVICANVSQRGNIVFLSALKSFNAAKLLLSAPESANTEMLHNDLIIGFQRNEAKHYAYQKYTVVRNDSQIAGVSKYKESFIPAVDDTKQRNHLICIHHPYSMCQHCGSEWISAVDPTEVCFSVWRR